MDGPSKTEEARRYVSTLRNEDTTNVLKLLYLTSKLSRLRETDQRGRCPPGPSARWHRPGLSAARSPNGAPLGSGSGPVRRRAPAGAGPERAGRREHGTQQVQGGDGRQAQRGHGARPSGPKRIPRRTGGRAGG